MHVKSGIDILVLIYLWKGQEISKKLYMFFVRRGLKYDMGNVCYLLSTMQKRKKEILSMSPCTLPKKSSWVLHA
jgi:hypothetical protein